METSGKKIVFFLGETWVHWDPVSVSIRGLAGSEIVLISLSSRLAKQGYEVIIYGMPTREGIYDGVQYYHYSKYKNIRCNILISQRAVHALDPEFNVVADVSFLWVHESNYGNTLTPQRAFYFDKVVCLSQWHRDYFLSYYTFIEPEKIIIIGNGIETDRYHDAYFDTARIRAYHNKFVRNPHKAFYSSASNRGLDVACIVWNKIREVIPDAELHVYYGFEVMELMYTRYNDTVRREQMIKTKDLIANTAGVVYHGRISPSLLAKEQLSCGVWAYPTACPETSCITAMEAQAAGCRIVTTAIGAVNETVGERGILIDGDCYGSKYQKEFVDRMIEVMVKPGYEDRLALQRYAFRNFNCDTMLNDWLETFELLYNNFTPKSYSYLLYNTMTRLRDINVSTTRIDYLLEKLSLGDTSCDTIDGVKSEFDLIKAEFDEQYIRIDESINSLNKVKLTR